MITLVELPPFFSHHILNSRERHLYLLVFLLMDTDIKSLIFLSAQLVPSQKMMSKGEQETEINRMVRHLESCKLVRVSHQHVVWIPVPLSVQRGLFANTAIPTLREKIDIQLHNSYRYEKAIRCFGFGFSSHETPYSSVQQALLTGEPAQCEKFIQRQSRRDVPHDWQRFVSDLVSQIVQKPTDVSPEVLVYLLSDIIEHVLSTPTSTTACSAILNAYLIKKKKLSNTDFLNVCAWYTWTGQQKPLALLLEQTDHPILTKAVEACSALLVGDFDKADKAFVKVFTQATSSLNHSFYRLPSNDVDSSDIEVGLCQNFFCLTLLAAIRMGTSKTRIHRIHEKLSEYSSQPAYLTRLKSDMTRLNQLANEGFWPETVNFHPCTTLLNGFLNCLEALFLDDGQISSSSIGPESVMFLKTAHESGLGFIAASLIPCVRRLNPDLPEAEALCETVQSTLSIAPLWEKILFVSAYERALGEMESLLPKIDSTAANSTTASTAFIKWFIALDGHDLDDIGLNRFEGKLIKRLKSGKWSSGAQIRLDKFVTGEYDAFLSEADKVIKEALRFYDSYTLSYGLSYGDRDAAEIFPALVDHPHVYLFSRSSRHEEPVGPVALVKGEVSLELKTASNGDLSINIPGRDDGPNKAVQLVKERDNHFVVYKRTALQMKLADVVRRYGKKGKLVVPMQSASRFQSLLPSLARTIDIKGDFDTEAVDARSVDGGVQLLLRGRFVEGNLSLDLLNRPVQDFPFFVVPGSGMRKTLTRHKEEMVAVCRDLEAERQALTNFLAACPSLPNWATGDSHWEVESLPQILAALDECHTLADTIPIEWPENDGLSIVRPQSGSKFSLTGSSGSDFWLEIGGDLTLDDGKVLAFGDLLSQIGSRTEGFVRLSETRYLHLTKKLATELELLSKTGELSAKGLRVPPCALPVLESLSDSPNGLTFPEFVRERIADFRKALKQKFTVPTSLTCELRPYQREGFAWMAKLAACGLGACLADDMGLGKTVQMLALLTHLGKRGPSLVIAPTSVSRNWQDEAAKFAPALNVTLLVDAPDRTALIRDAGPFDVIVCSYGILLFEEELLAGREWNVAVLDEAQAVKNRQAKRARIVKRLHCSMRTISTGTPVENNLGELWSLFDFINPGLLGTHGQFERRYCNADGSVSALLKKMTAPFILRRLKSEVLEDLPPKTEISLEVVLGDEERALYESCRRDALTALEGGKEEEANHIAILAHLTRLRRVCCHPSLVLPNSKLAGQKVDTFMELVTDLKAAGHRALVFSQFVDFLSIIRTRLDQELFTYQYLDGSTPLKQRTEAVTNFQRGEGELFLISLKAGGTGLNLTAANYVILLDPWWNPAVEMQAADRAHRIGQKNPVTIYRLVTTNTVEERVIELHSRKQALADAILEGAGSTRLSAVDLTNLFKA